MTDSSIPREVAEALTRIDFDYPSAGLVIRAHIAAIAADNERLRGAFDDTDERASVHWYAEWVGEKQRADALAERCAGMERALAVFAELAGLFDEGRRGGNMPRADDDPVMQWPRMDKDYGFTVGDLRAARAALAHQETTNADA